MRREIGGSRFAKKPIFHQIDERFGESGTEIAAHNSAERFLSGYQTSYWSDLGSFFWFGDWRQLEERLKSSSGENKEKLLKRIEEILKYGFEVLITNRKLISADQREHREVELMILQLAAATGIDLSTNFPELVQLAEKVVSLSVKKE